jgi:branched-chain amino acid transport system substrate-binding protein
LNSPTAKPEKEYPMSEFRPTRRSFTGSLLGLPAITLFPERLLAQSGPIRIGCLFPLTGAAGAYGPNMAKAAQRTVEWINSDGGGVLGGRKLEILVEDSESNATAGVNAAKKLIEVYNVSCLIGLWNSSVAMAVKPITIGKKLALFVSGSADQITEGDNQGLVWRFQARGKDWGPAIARAMLKSGAKSSAVMCLQNPFTVTMVEPFANEFKKGGGQVVETVYYNPGQTSYRAEVEKVFASKPDAVFFPSLLPDFTVIAKEVFRSGFSAKLFTLSIAGDSEGKFAQNVGNEVAEGINHLQPTPPVNSPAYKQFLKLMGEPEGKLFLFACNTYDQVAVLSMCIEASKTDVSADWVKNIRNITNGPGDTVSNPIDGLKAIRSGKRLNYSGAGSDCDFNERGDLISREFSQFVIKGGKSELVSTTM